VLIQKLLIANRGEIACRIIRTARAMGITTVAVYSDADAKALHVRQADEAVLIGPSPASESYLVGEKIIAAAKATGAEAIHPGYGFLSENAGFAQAVIDAGLIWVGPKPASIEAMGLKDAAKERMIAAGVPVTPGYLGQDQTVGRLKNEADAIGYPVLIKAVAGGGGKGMRKVDAAADFEAALESCRREAKASFSNDEVLLEKWITSPRHIEVQVFGDSHGNVVHMFERDCSLQRRHQKVIEEAPAPGMDEATRQAICEAAVRAAKAVEYEGAGTIEFIADASEGLRADRIFFMEMNTRLQVEHPVTEEITGVDLVEWQLRVASGEPIPLRQEELSINGWAIEARLYAEDPLTFLPSIGQLSILRFPEADEFEADLRIETGVEEGDIVSPFYDPMVAKVIVHGEDRDLARLQLAKALEHLAVYPVVSNAPFLLKCLMHSDFAVFNATTGFIATNEETLLQSVEVDDATKQLAAENVVGMYLPSEDSQGLLGFRLNSERCQTVHISLDRNTTEVKLPSFEGVEVGGAGGVITQEGRTIPYGEAAARGEGSHHTHDGDVIAPMPGKVIAVDVADGDAVTAGQRLMVLEAMKMEHALTAPFDGVVDDLSVKLGDQVQVEALLATVIAQD